MKADNTKETNKTFTLSLPHVRCGCINGSDAEWFCRTLQRCRDYLALPAHHLERNEKHVTCDCFHHMSSLRDPGRAS